MRLLSIFLLMFSCVAYGQELNNPNRLPLCPKDQNARYHNCWGPYQTARGDKYVGEFENDKFQGQGTYYHLADSEFKGDKYVGEFKDGKFNGLGTYTWSDGLKHFGEFRNDDFHGEGIRTTADGKRAEGIWENGKFIREAKVNLPSFNNNLANNTDRSDIERDRQQLAEERRRLEEEKRQQQAKNNNPSKQTTVTDSRRRFALVIGNAKYKNSPLRNPTNDADLISNALTSSGFIVSRYDNLTYAKMREVVKTFGEKLKQGDVGLFYFSGHAVQYRGKNYLLPINEDLKHADEIPSTAMDIDFVLAKMETAKNDLNIVILDACRNNPLGSEARNLDRGLTTISAAKGTFIAFATSPGNVALDGAGRNSPYTKNLAQAILKGGLSLEQVFKEVRRNVISETNSQQVPWENSSILGDFYFRSEIGLNEPAPIAGDTIKIGFITDMSGVYADVDGPAGAEAIKMAIADFGGKVNGKKIEFLSADHQNKADTAASKAREWFDQQGLDLLIGGTNSAASLAMAKVAAEKKKPFIAIGAGTSRLTNEECTPFTIHYAYDTTALARGTSGALVQQGLKSWFFLTADYVFGMALKSDASDGVAKSGGRVLGSVFHPLAATDFSSFFLQAEKSKAQVLGLANAGGDTVNAIKAAAEFGTNKKMKLAGLLIFINDVHALGLDLAQGLYLTEGWYWDTNEESRAWSKRFMKKNKKAPSMLHAADYSATTFYLNAVEALGNEDGTKVIEKLKSTPINDFFAKNGVVRPDGRMVHDMILMQVKSPAESKYAWDYYKPIQVIPGEKAFITKAETKCALWK